MELGVIVLALLAVVLALDLVIVLACDSVSL